MSPSQAKALGNPQALSNPQEEALCSRESQAGRNVHTVKAASISHSENAPSHCVEDKFELQDWDDFHRLNNEEGITTIYATLIDVTSHARGPCDVLPASGLGSSLTHQMDSVLSTKLYDESHIPTDGRGVPNLYADFSDLFRDKSTERVPLPPHRPHDLAIDFVPDVQGNVILPNIKKIYPMSPKEEAALSDFLADALDKKWIRHSESPIAAPCFYVPKPNGGLRLCIDYRQLNAITKKQRYPLPLFDDLMPKLLGGESRSAGAGTRGSPRGVRYL